VHVDASTIALGAIMAQPGIGELDHPIEFSRRKLSELEHNYNTTEREGLDMVYALQNFRHYLLGKHFKISYKSFNSQIPNQQASIGGENLYMVTVVPGI
jgi:hypothetical protein